HREINPAIVGREVKKAGGKREVQDGAYEHHAPADAIGEPSPDIGADDRADPGTHQHDGRLTKGEFPGADQEGEHEADQEVVEEFERVADDSCDEDFDLVAGQTRPAIENLEHDRSPVAHVHFPAAVAPYVPQYRKATPRSWRTTSRAKRRAPAQKHNIRLRRAAMLPGRNTDNLKWCDHQPSLSNRQNTIDNPFDAAIPPRLEPIF